MRYVFVILFILTATFLSGPSAPDAFEPPVSCQLSFENLDFASGDWVEQTGLKTIEERKWELVEGRFGRALFLGATPLKYDNDNMSGLDLDMVTAVIFNVAYAGRKGRGYDEPFIWGAGKLHPGAGTVAFWVKGTSKPESEDARTILFEQTTTSWGRKERQLIEIELLRDGAITAYVEDARYHRHAVKTKPVWRDDNWNHVVFMWDRSSGVSLWVNGSEAASSMGADAWWENQRPGLFHLPMARSAYDEFYIFDRTLTENEIGGLYRNNTVPTTSRAAAPPDKNAVQRLKDAFSSDTSALPTVRPSNGDAVVFTEITPQRIHDEGIQGWWIADGRYELAWPHEYSVFTIIPGDVDFHAEKADILPPKASEVNYITFEGNLDGVEVLAGDRDGSFGTSPVLRVPKTEGFFYGATLEGLGDRELRIPLTKEYGTPPGFESYGDVLKLPQSGNLRLHEVGIFNLGVESLPPVPGARTMYLNAQPLALDDNRYPKALEALFTRRDRTVAGIYKTFENKRSTFAVEPMGRLQMLSEKAVGKYCFDTVVADLWVMSPTEGNVLQLRFHDPAVPSHTWSHAEVRLSGFTGEPKRLRVALRFDPAFLVAGDRVWLELVATDGLTVITGDPHRKSSVILMPEIDWTRAEPVYSLKTMRPCIMTYGRSFEYIPWEWDKRLPDVDAPENFGGMFDMAYPWQAVRKVAPGDRIANIYKAYLTFEYPRGKAPKNIEDIPETTFAAPANAPDWAVYFREFQGFRGKIVTWWRHHQRSDGQAGGGWNDDTLIFSRAFGDMPLDSNADALTLYNKVFAGFEKTNYFKGGFCRIHPIDRLHNGDFVRERYKSLIYNLGDPQSAVWAMEEAWHYGKEEETPVNYGDGKAFLFGKDVLEWYWGRQKERPPYRLGDRDTMINTLRTAAIVNNEITLWRFTEAWCHTDDQRQYGAEVMNNLLLGGWGSSPRRNDPDYYSKNINITVGVGWIEGGGPQLGRLVEYSGGDGLKVHLYSFDRFERKAVARLFRLASGTYDITLSADRDGDGTYEATVTRDRREIRRFDRLELNVPPRTPVLLDVSQVAANPEGDLPDLATGDDFVALNGNTINVTVFNLGPVPSGKFTVTVRCPRGKALKTVESGSIEGSADFVPRKTVVSIPGLASHPTYTIEIDADDSITEIFDENNTATVLTGNF